MGQTAADREVVAVVVLRREAEDGHLAPLEDLARGGASETWPKRRTRCQNTLQNM
jgi:hypothetical protein